MQLNIIKKLFGDKTHRRYSLKIVDFFVRDHTLWCQIDDVTHVNPLKLAADNILSDDRIMSQIKPVELLVLKERYDRFKQDHVVIAEVYSDNKYKLSYCDKAFAMTGKDICKDSNLLKSMMAEDIFRVAYRTGYVDAMKNNAELNALEKAETESSNLNKNKNGDNVLTLKRK